MTKHIQKIIFLFLCLFINKAIPAQTSLPTIRATSKQLDIRVGNDFYAKGGWILDPDKKPDVFSIGSHWFYNSMRVAFITDIDSISLNVQPGHSYDFIVLLNNKTPCSIQIAAHANPLFMNESVATLILSAFIIVLIAFYFIRKKIRTKWLLWLGYLAPLLFWLMTFIGGYLHGNYTLFKNTISELGAIGSDSELFTSSSLVIIAMLYTLFSIGFYRASRANNLSVLPAVLSFSMPLSMIWASIFALGNDYHSLIGPIPFFTTLASLLSYLLWRKNAVLLRLRAWSLFSFFIMLLIFLKFINPFANQYEGLIQRFFYLGWTAWTVKTAYYFRRI
jgi:hypothetical membrane protein